MDHPTRVATNAAAAFLLASALYWLAMGRRPEGLFGMLQDALAPLALRFGTELGFGQYGHVRHLPRADGGIGFGCCWRRHSAVSSFGSRIG